QEGWRTSLAPGNSDLRNKLLADDGTPTTRIASWGNAEATPEALTPNLLSPKNVRIHFKSDIPHFQFARVADAMVDGKANAPPEPWLRWHDLGHSAELAPVNSIVFDTFRRQLRITGITLVE